MFKTVQVSVGVLMWQEMFIFLLFMLFSFLCSWFHDFENELVCKQNTSLVPWQSFHAGCFIFDFSKLLFLEYLFLSLGAS